MKKEQFRTMVKEIIKEVISEFETEIGEGQNAYPAGGVNDPKIDARNQKKKDWAAKKASLDTLKDPNPSNKTPFFRGSADEAKQHSMFPKDDPAGTEDGKSSDQKIQARNKAWKNWEDNMKMLRGIHDDPAHQEKLAQARKARFEEP
jgi:hypothetical protein